MKGSRIRNAKARPRAILVAALVLGLGGPGLAQRVEVPSPADDLRHPDPEVRAEAVGALGRAGGDVRWTVARLVRSIDDPDAGVRARVAEELGRIGRERVQPGPDGMTCPDGLGTLLGDPDAWVRARAASAVAGWGGGALGLAARSLAMPERRDGAVSACYHLFAHHDFASPASVPHLGEALRRALADVRTRATVLRSLRAARALLPLEPAEARSWIEESALSGEAGVATALVLTSADGRAVGAAALAALLESDDAAMRETALWAVGARRIADGAPIERARESLRHPDAGVRATAAWVLGCRDPRSVPREARSIAGSVARWRRARGDGSARGFLPDALPVVWPERPFVTCGGGLYSQPDELELPRALEPEHAPRRILEALTTALADPAGDVRATAAWALGYRAPSHATRDALLGLCADERDDVRMAAVVALARRGELVPDSPDAPVVIDALFDAVRRGGSPAAFVAALGLARFDESLWLPSVEPLLASEDALVAQASVELLARVDPAFERHLERIAGALRAGNRAAAPVLARAGRRGLDALLDGLRSPDAGVRGASARWLDGVRGLGDADRVTTERRLRDLARRDPDPRVREEAEARPR